MCETGEGGEVEFMLHSAFKGLKVDRIWNTSKLPEDTALSVHKLWASDGPGSEMNSDALKSDGGSSSQQSRKLKVAVVKPSPRSAPYKKPDELPHFEKLSFTSEVCTRKGCECMKSTGRESSESGLNYARACGKDGKYSQAVLREARLRLHNHKKDHSEVLRAARLKLHKHAQTASWGNKLALPSQSKALFKSTNVKDLPNFQSVAAAAAAADSQLESKKEKKKSDGGEDQVTVNFGLSPFTSLRSPPTTSSANASAPGADSLDLQSLGSTLPSTEATPPASSCVLHPGRCSGPCSCTCAQQARLHPDDLTVEELACYLEDFVYIPRKMSSMAEMMYT